MHWMIILFLLLSILMVVEASTSLSRLTGYLLKTPESGLILQSSLGLVSRMVMFLFMPFIGYLSDKQALHNSNITMLIAFSLMPISLYILYTLIYKFINFYSILITRIRVHGSLFRGVVCFGHAIDVSVLRLKRIRALNGFYYLVFIAYIPYYLAWPMVIVLLNIFHDYRGMILGMSSVFNGINTIILTMFVDPKLIKIGKLHRLLPTVYIKLIKIRIYACCVAVFFLVSYFLVFLP